MIGQYVVTLSRVPAISLSTTSSNTTDTPILQKNVRSNAARIHSVLGSPTSPHNATSSSSVAGVNIVRAASVDLKTHQTLRRVLGRQCQPLDQQSHLKPQPHEDQPQPPQPQQQQRGELPPRQQNRQPPQKEPQQPQRHQRHHRMIATISITTTTVTGTMVFLLSTTRL